VLPIKKDCWVVAEVVAQTKMMMPMEEVEDNLITEEINEEVQHPTRLVLRDVKVRAPEVAEGRLVVAKVLQERTYLWRSSS